MTLSINATELLARMRRMADGNTSLRWTAIDRLDLDPQALDAGMAELLEHGLVAPRADGVELITESTR